MRKKFLDFIALLFVILWTISPPMQLALSYRILALGCVGFLALKNKFAMDRKHFFAFLFIAFIAASNVIENDGLSDILTPIAFYLLFVGYSLIDWYDDSLLDFRMIIPIILLVLALWNTRTASEIAVNPNAARDIVRNNDLANGYLRRGIGGYGLLYCQVCIVPAITMWVLSAFKHNKLFFAVGVIWEVTFFRFLLISGYTIATVSTFIGLAMLFIYRRKSVAPALVLSLLFLVLLVYLIGYNDAFRTRLLEYFDGTKVAVKINDIYTSITTEETADSIYERIKRYSDSLNVIKKYPLIGCWFLDGVGGHSALLDAFAKYGLFGGIMMLRMVYYVPRKWKAQTKSTLMLRTVNATIIPTTMVACLNSMPYNLVMMLTAVLAIIYAQIENWSKKHENSVGSQPDPGRSGRRLA